MATEETALTSGSTGGTTPSTDAGLAPQAPAAPTSGSDTGGLGAAIDATAQALTTQQTDQPAELDTILGGIPADDTDIQQYQGHAAHQALVSTRGQLRVLSNAVRELQPLGVFRELGEPSAVKSRLEIHRLLYTPVLDASGQVVRDPITRTGYVTTKPLWEYLDKNSPGMIEQALVDLSAYPFDTGLEDERGQPIREPGFHQLLRHFKLNPARLAEYRNIDALIQRTSGAITPEELAEIPAEYHAAYRTIPHSVRLAMKTYEEADQTRLLEDYKGKLEAAQREEERARRDKAQEARDQAAHQMRIAAEQDKYLDTIRRERTALLIKSLARQVQFSTDPVTNQVMLGSLAATMAQLLDPVWRFVVVEQILTPLGLTIDHTFDEVLAKFDTNASDSVADRLNGDVVQSQDKANLAHEAANQLMSKIAVFALKVAARQGATMQEAANIQGAALAGATSVRPGLGSGGGSAPSNENGGLPPGMKPGTPEANRYIAEKTGFYRAPG